MNNNLLHELIIMQRQNINNNMRLSYNDLKRINKYINKSIFNNDECILWNGYISILKNNQHQYINFFFNKKKYSLQRLLYMNYIDDLEINEYIKYKCCNNGSCCNINHFYKVNDLTKKNKNINKNKSNTKIELNNPIIVNFN